MDRTGIKAINLKFYIDSERAQVGIDVETRNMEKRLVYFEKLENIRNQVSQALGENVQWELEYIRENEKSVSRVYTEIQNVSIFDKTTWNRVNMFFFDRMSALEKVFLEYKEILQ